MEKTDLDPHGPPPEPIYDLSSIVPPEKLLAPGVYFDLDENIYHAAFALSSTGIKHLRVSPYDWWVRSALNPRQAEVSAEEVSDAREMGKAFDARIICGKDYFYARYAPAISPADPAYKGVLRTADDLREWLETRGYGKQGKTKDILIGRVLEADPTARIWDVILDGYQKQHKDKTLLDYGLIEKIELAAAMIEKHPELSKALSGGAPQVSVVWYCEATGVLCKARFDYLKPKLIADLKTFEPRGDIPIEMAIGKEIGFRKYYVQSSFYREASMQIPDFIRAGKVFGNPPPGILDLLLKHKDKEFAWVFQIKGVAPTAFGYVLPKTSILWTLGEAICDQAKHTFRHHLDVYGALPWIDPTGFRNLDDANVPSWSLL